MTRTFSKLYGLGGLRLGWAYCSPDVAERLNRIRNIYNVNRVAQVAGIAALSDDGHARLVHRENHRVPPVGRE